jgi:hypothetical protein
VRASHHCLEFKRECDLSCAGVLLSISLLLVANVTHAQLKVDMTDGGSVVTALGYGIEVNKGSSLKRTLVVINDASSPLSLTDTGVAPKYQDRGYSFLPTGYMTPKEPVAAVEIRFVLFDMFGTPMTTLSAIRVKDFGAEKTPLGEASWYASESNVRGLLTVASFVAHVRTASGKIWRYNEKRIGEELAKLNLRVSAGALEPPKEERRQ